MDDCIDIYNCGSDHKYYTQIPNIIYELDLSFQEVGFYTFIKRVAGEKGSFFIGRRKICEKFKISPQTLQKIKKNLELKGLISLKKITTNGQTRDVIKILDIWKLNMDHFSAKEGWFQIEPGVVPNRTGGGSDWNHKKNYTKNIKNKNNKRIRAPDVKFLQLRERVKLTEKQHEVLKKKYSTKDLDWILDKLNHYKEDTGKQYKSDMKAIQNWVELALTNKKNKEKAEEGRVKENIKNIKKLQTYLENHSARGNLQIQKNMAVDTVLNKQFTLSSTKTMEVVTGWYGVRIREEKSAV